uniref:Uncharacterized protein n=1 Tax=Sphaerodactylus townsendi TaxID=933632 RepID=A0ACB8G4H6_9SAUR
MAEASGFSSSLLRLPSCCAAYGQLAVRRNSDAAAASLSRSCSAFCAALKKVSRSREAVEGESGGQPAGPQRSWTAAARGPLQQEGNPRRKLLGQAAG